MTAFKRRARYQQAWWRERQDFPIGAQPIAGGSDSRPLGSRLPLEFAKATGANFLTKNAHRAVQDRLAKPEPHQMLNESRLWADLLSSMPMCFNMFGDLRYNVELADDAVRSWWPDLPGVISEVRFEWSPGRLDPGYLGNRTAFDAAFIRDLGDGHQGVVGIETKYHEHPQKEDRPKPERLRRYIEVTERSHAFADGALEPLIGTPLQQIWLDHLLALAMLQHPSGRWQRARFVLVHPAANTGFAHLAEQYRSLLVDQSTFEVRTTESLLAALPDIISAAFRDRYLWAVKPSGG